jgi:DNA-binding transcriptional MerR regulator
MDCWKVGELAKRVGLTVRTLHHYDQIGLLSPSRRNRAGYRLYSPSDIARLQQILSLRQLGLSLEEIRDGLRRPDFSAARVLRLHIARLKERIAAERTLLDRLEAIERRLAGSEQPGTEELLNLMEMMIMFEKYYTPEQLEQLKERGRALGDEAICAVEAEWPALIAEVRSAMEQGIDPASEQVQRLARRWMELVRAFTGGDPAIEKSLGSMYRQEPALRERAGIDPAMFEYVSRAMTAARQAPG